MMTPKSLLWLILILVVIGSIAGFFIYKDFLKTKFLTGERKNQENQQFKPEIPDLDKPIIISEKMPERQKDKMLKEIKDIRQSLKKDKNNFQNWLQLGLLLKSVGDYKGAEKVWQYASFLKPKNSITFHNLGDLYHYYLKDYQKAEENYLKALENNPSQIFTYQNLYELYRYSYKEKSDQADDILLEGIKNNPQSAYLMILLAEYYESQKDFKDAVEFYSRALKLRPMDKGLKERLKKIKKIRGKKDLF